MPEIRFQIQWPDGSQETCYSPSLVVKDYFTPNSDYDLGDFVQRSRSGKVWQPLWASFGAIARNRN